MAISRKDLVELFGEQSVLARPEAVAALNLDPETSRILTDVGLPSTTARGLPPGVTPLLSVVPLERIDGPRAGTGYVHFGRLLGDAAEACVDPHTGTVVALTAEGGGTAIEVFVNSTLGLFLEALYLVNQMNSEQVDADQETYTPAVDGLYERLAALDPPAMADGSWWTAVVEEMRYGLM